MLDSPAAQSTNRLLHTDTLAVPDVDLPWEHLDKVDDLKEISCCKIWVKEKWLVLKPA